MRCIICGGTSFSIRSSDIGKSREQQFANSKYGDCCSLSCALKKSQRLIAHNGFTLKKYSVSPNSTYVVKIPNTSLECGQEKEAAEPESNIQTVEV